VAGRNDGNTGSDNTRPEYRDNDDQRDNLPGDDRAGTEPENNETKLSQEPDEPDADPANDKRKSRG